MWLGCLFACGFLLSAPRLELIRQPFAADQDLALVSWSHDAGPTLETRPCLAQLRGSGGEPNAWVWAGFDVDNFYLRVVVWDPEHVNHRRADTIWEGDAIQVNIDPRGEGAPGLSQAADFIGAGAMSVTFALTEGGTETWVYLRGGTDHAGALVTPTKIERNEVTKHTTYAVVLPWQELRTVMGQSPTMGLSVQLNDTDNQGHQTRVRWGGTPAGTFRPAALAKLRFAVPPVPYLAAAVVRPEIWHSGDFGALEVIADNSLSIRIHGRFGSLDKTFDVPAETGSGLRRFELRAYPNPDDERPVPLRVRASNANGDFSVGAQVTLTYPSQLVADGLRDLQRQAAAAKDSLLNLHLRSLLALFQQQWAAAQTLLTTNPQVGRDVITTLNKAATTWKDPERLASQLHGGSQQLLLTAVSSVDQSLQPYVVQLPHGITNNAQRAPVIVSLHGKGDSRLMAFMGGLMDGSSANRHDALILTPWARGNMYYEGPAEVDVLDALDDVERRFQVDTKRVYLTGFSMGGAGAWSLGLHYPDVWAAVAITSGASWLTPLKVGMGSNAATLPFHIWHGDADGSVDVREAYKMRQELTDNGNHPSFTIIPKGGHVSTDEHFAEVATWLLKHSQQQSSDFSFVSDSWDHRWRRGISLLRETEVSAFPRVHCRIDGQRVMIDSTGTRGVNVDLGPGGLNLRGDVTVTYNGGLVYQGPPNTVVMGMGAGSR